MENFIVDDIPRCPECKLICSLILKYKEEKPIIDYNCENGHKGSLLLNEYMKKSKFSIFKQICEECGKKQEQIKKEFIYCSKCDKILCNSCFNNHSDGDQHNFLFLKKFDSSCKNHSNIFCSYCINCQKNLCIICKKEHNNHKLTDLSDFDFSQKSKFKLENQLKNLEKNIQQLEIIKQSIIIEINKSKELNKLQIRFIKLLLITHQYEKESNNLNFHFVQNIKNIIK